ncbi:Histamine H1 receptor [Bagarius yarrelli]|uniref:Histamine H1 receptor n=1 Tax=Bagarius yarrelli TaxID=175774 RepID=A0A556TRD4_BAGYA|nr:Histamine H1 receptor [Bagarius yarrelli]
MFANVDQKPELESKCDTDFRFVTWFKVLTAILNFYIPSFLMLWFYSQIFIAVREHYKQWESMTIAKVVADENINMQSLNSQKTFQKMAKEETLALHTCSQKEGMCDQYTLEQLYISRDANEENGESGSEKSKHKKKIFKIMKQKKKTAMESHEVSSVNQEINSESPSKDPSLSLGILQQEENTDLKMFVSVTDCNVLVPNSVANICEITANTDVQKHITILSNDDANANSPVLQESWAHDDCPDIDGGNTMSLKQTWQKFCEQSRQCVQNMRVHKERKAVRQLGFIIGAFMVCWIPYFITFMVMALCNTCVHHDLHMFTIWLGYINSTLNPFIYPLCNENFKRVFKKFFRIKQ